MDADLTNKHGKDTKEDAIKALSACKSQDDLTQAWQDYSAEYGNDKEFRAAYMKQLNAIQNGTITQ